MKSDNVLVLFVARNSFKEVDRRARLKELTKRKDEVRSLALISASNIKNFNGKPD